METTRLELFFLDELEEKTKLSIDEPRMDLIPTEIETAMDNIIAANIFVGKGGKFVSKVGAQVVTVSINEMEF